MLNLQDFEQKQKTYDLFKDNDGNVISVGLPTQYDLVKIGKFQLVTENLEKEYNKIKQCKKMNEKDIDKMDMLYRKLIDVTYNMFLFIANLNTVGKTFAIDDIKNIPYNALQTEINNYTQFINDALKN